MFKNIAAAAVISIFFATSAFANDPFLPKLVTSPVDRAFVPTGFDTNDNTEVILQGYFPNTCYKVGPTTFVVDEVNKTIEIEASSYKYTGGCALVMVPFIQTVSVGMLKSGTYIISVKDRPATVTAPLGVTDATTSNPDDFLYAPVATVSIENVDESRFVVVEGEWPHMLIGCMVMKEVKQNIINGVIIVQPIAEIIDDQRCDDEQYQWNFKVQSEITDPMTESDYLLHVRVASGSSLNRYYVVQDN
jgi:hypothetical protein